VASDTSSEFAGFLANPGAQDRGGKATQTARGQQRRGLLERVAQAEVNRRLRAEVVQKAKESKSLIRD